jgi:hypothetical protein
MVNITYSFDKNGFGYILGDFLTNSSGHPKIAMLGIYQNYNQKEYVLSGGFVALNPNVTKKATIFSGVIFFL